MSNTLSLGSTGEAPGGPRYFVSAMLAACLGVALYSGVLVGAWMLSIEQFDLLAVVWMTLLFAVPLAVGLFRLGRIGIIGMLLLTVGITAAHFAAIFAAASTYEPGPLFATAAQRAADAAREQLSSFKTGAVGGAVGAALSFVFIAMLAPDLRDRRRLGDYALATLVLAALAAVAFIGLSARGKTATPVELALFLYVPWQLVFGFAIVSVFTNHQAVRRIMRRASPDRYSRDGIATAFLQGQRRQEAGGLWRSSTTGGIAHGCAPPWRLLAPTCLARTGGPF